MVSKEVTLINGQGMHMRPAKEFVNASLPFKSKVTIHFNDRDINGRSIMGIMAACMKKGSVLTISCEGPDEQANLDALVALVESGLGEE